MRQTIKRPGKSGNGNGSHQGKGEKQKFTAPTIPSFQLPRESRKHYTPYLLVRDAAGDTGARPLPGGTVFWESPDVWVESSLGINQPVVGEPNRVFARVTNLGWQYATGVTVKFYWADPSLAITETSANLFGIGFADIPSGWSVVVESRKPWVPVEENGGHECLIAEAYIPVFDPLTSPMDPVDDRHVGQKNEQLVQVAAGMAFTTKVKALNAVGLEQPLTFEVQPLRLAAVHPLVEARARMLRVALQGPSPDVLPLSLRMHDDGGVYTGPSTLFASRLLEQARQEIAGTSVDTSASVQIAHTARFAPWESRTVEIRGQVPAGAQPGQTFTFRIVQRIGRMIAGGYTVNVLVV